MGTPWRSVSRREFVVVEVAAVDEQVEGGEAEAGALAVVELLDPGAVDLAVEDRHLVLRGELVEEPHHRLLGGGEPVGVGGHRLGLGALALEAVGAGEEGPFDVADAGVGAVDLLADDHLLAVG